jgi:hypothetical protein
MAETVSVGCKYPNGLLLELGDKRVEIKGANSSQIIGGHGITEGVDKAFMDEWMKRYAANDIVKGGHLFINVKTASVVAEAEEKADHKTGLEPLDPKKKPVGIQAADTPQA